MKQWPLPVAVSSFTVVPLACFRGRCTDVAHEFQDRIQNGRERGCWDFSEQELDLSVLYSVAPPKGGAHFPGFLLWEPTNQPGTTAMLSNCMDGLQRRLLFLNQIYGRECMRVLLSRDYNYMPECCFEFFGERGQHRRVEVFRERKWEFRSEGEPLAFEDLAIYRRKVLRERLTPEIIVGYLSRAGWEVAEDMFWMSEEKAVLARQLRWGPDLTMDELFPEG